MASTPTPSSPSLSPSLAEDLTPTAYITMFSLGSIVLIFLVTIACYGILRTRNISDHQAPLFAERSAAKRGLDEGTIGSCPKMTFSQLKNVEFCGNSSACTDSTFCSICLADYKEVDMVLLLPNCGHFFHDKCVDQWLKLRPTCPICRDTPIPVFSASVPPDGGLEGQEFRPG